MRIPFSYVGRDRLFRRLSVLVLIAAFVAGACDPEPNEGPGECDPQDTACGAATPADLPDVVGATLQDGARVLRQAGFNVFVMVGDRSIKPTRRNLRLEKIAAGSRIIDQDPAPGDSSIFFGGSPVYLSVRE